MKLGFEPNRKDLSETRYWPPFQT